MRYHEESGQEICDLVQKYLDNPLWHLPQITNFLLLDLIDFDLISLEGTFYFGLFAPNISDEIGESLQNKPPCVTPKSKKARRKWYLEGFWIGIVLVGFLWVVGVWVVGEGQTISDVMRDEWINVGVPSWIFDVISVIAFYLLFIAICLIGWPCASLVLKYIHKRKIKYNSICSQANDLLNIRWDISSGTYDAKTCIERLKKLDDQDLHTSSLIYKLLRLQA